MHKARMLQLQLYFRYIISLLLHSALSLFLSADVTNQRLPFIHNCKLNLVLLIYIFFPLNMISQKKQNKTVHRTKFFLRQLQ